MIRSAALPAIKTLVLRFFHSLLMGCFVSCFRRNKHCHGCNANGNGIGKVRSSGGSSDAEPYFDLVRESLEGELLAAEQEENENLLGSLFFNDVAAAEEDLDLDLPPTLEDELRLEANHLKLCGVIPETPMEIRNSNRRVALQEINGLDQSPRSARTSTSKTPGSRKESPISQFKTPNSRSAKETRGGDLKLTSVRYGMSARASNLNSPYPTPITLTDDMQTPATIYSSYKETSGNGKRIRIRSQYVYPELKGTCEADVSSGMKFDELERENGVAGEFSFGTKQNLVETPKQLVAGLSKWLKPTSSLRDRNGIPNSTTKYKEDQQIKWHATPFEERLEKVLSDEKLPPSRKHNSGRLIEFNGQLE